MVEDIPMEPEVPNANVETAGPGTLKAVDLGVDAAVYRAHLTKTVADVVGQYRFGGLDYKAYYCLIMEEIAEKEKDAGYPAPDGKEMEEILRSFWNPDEIGKSQQKHDKKELIWSKNRAKPAPKKGKHTMIFPPSSGIHAPVRRFHEFAPNASVLCEVARMKESGMALPTTWSKYHEEDMKKVNLTATATYQVKVVDVLLERMEKSKSSFANEEIILEPDEKVKPEVERQWEEDRLRRHKLVERLLGFDEKPDIPVTEQAKESAPTTRAMRGRKDSTGISSSREASVASLDNASKSAAGDQPRTTRQKRAAAAPPLSAKKTK